MKQRSDTWTAEQDTLLAETVLKHIREGSTQLIAFEEVGEKLSRTSAGCGFRWNGVLRHQYSQAIELAKKDRLKLKRSRKESIQKSNTSVVKEKVVTEITPAPLNDGGLQKVFDYSGQTVKTIVKDGEIWFIAKDVADVLEYTDAEAMTRNLDEDEKQNLQIVGFNRGMIVINEAGLYAAILKSRKPEAKLFKRWITHEVLPTIRKTGGYVANDDLFVNTYLQHADEQTKAIFKATLETVRKQNEQISIMAPKAEYFDALVDRNLLTNFRDTAKELHIKQGEFIDWLLDNKYVYRDTGDKLKPYMQYVPELFELKEWEKNNKTGTQTLITPKGRETFRLFLKRKPSAPTENLM